MIAFFPGKFQPPHLGHVLTILDLSDKYDEIIVGVTEDKPEVISQTERVEIFMKVFRRSTNIRVVPIQGIISNYRKNDIKNLPNFDVCISGNQKVLDQLALLGYETTYQGRSVGIGYSGSEIRSLIHE